jgi:hypothetical protein
MARARNIKPGFFKNEDLAECSPWARLCFAGLWTLADREGRLEDRPKRIKGELFAFDTIDVEPLLKELERFKFIVRYETDGMKAIQISEFARHQSPHYSEIASVIKPPSLPESTGKETPIKGGSQPPDSLIPDSLIPEEKTFVASATPKLPACPTDELIALYHEHLPTLPRVEILNDTRRKHLSARWREVIADKEIAASPDPKAEALAWFAWFFKHANRSAFLTGKSGDWRAGFDFLIAPKSFAKVIEGNYHKAAA